MPWPLSQDYNEAVQSPALSFSDPELQQAEAKCNAIGLPMPCSGNFADVYEMTGPGDKRWAVKCFTRQKPGLRERYAAISAYLKQVDLPFMVDFAYLDPGIKVRGLWYPVLKMDWVEGLTLNEFVKQNADQPATLDALCQIWVKLAQRLGEARIAHADLQHGNLLLVPGKRDGTLSVKLIDYDGMWVPALARSQSGEVGHPAYQHPRRLREGTYSAEVDRFPHLVIYTALRSLTAGSRYLWNKYDNGDNLLFRQADLTAPAQSPLFRELIQLKDDEVRMLAQAVSIAANKPLEETPLLDTVASEQVAITPVRNRPRSSVAAPETVAAEPLIHSSKRRRKRSPIAAMLIGMACFVGLVAGGWWLTDRYGSRSFNNGPAVAQREPAAKSKANPETQPEAKLEHKPEPKPEPRTEPKSGPKPEPNAAPKPGSTLSTIPTMQAQAHEWIRGSPNVKMISNDQGFCFLSSLGGCFAGGGEEVKVSLEKDGWWYLAGRTLQSLVGRSMSMQGPQRQLFETEVKEYTWQLGGAPVKLLSQNDGFCCLSGVGGGFHGKGEKVGVFLGLDRYWYLHGRYGRKTKVWGHALSIRTRKPGSFRATVTEYSWSAGKSPIKMIRSAEGFCFLSCVGGHFAGGGEEVKVYLGDDGYWYLGGRSRQRDLDAKAISITFLSQ